MSTLARVQGGRVALTSRNDIDMSPACPELRALGERLGTTARRTRLNMWSRMRSMTTTPSGPSDAPPAQVWPTLRARDARAPIRFLVEAFGFEETAA